MRRGAEFREIEVDGEDRAAGEDAVVADGAAAAAVGEDGQAIGAAGIVGVDVAGGGFRAKAAAVAGGSRRRWSCRRTERSRCRRRDRFRCRYPYRRLRRDLFQLPVPLPRPVPCPAPAPATLEVPVPAPFPCVPPVPAPEDDLALLPFARTVAGGCDAGAVDAGGTGGTAGGGRLGEAWTGGHLKAAVDFGGGDVVLGRVD